MQPPAQPTLFQPPDFVAHAGTHRPSEDDSIDWLGVVHQKGLAAARPAAGRTNKGCLYLATDTNGGTVYLSDGATWTQVAAGVTTDTTATNAIPKSTGTTKGDIITYTGSSTPVRRGVPANNNILYADSTQADGWNVGLIAQAMLTAGYRMEFAGTSAPGSPSAGDLWYDTTNKIWNSYNGSVWITITPASASVATSQTTTNAAYVDLATVGPAVTVLTGTAAVVTLSCSASNSNSLITSRISVAVSGATTLAASDANCVQTVGQGVPSISRTYKLTGLTAGSNTFTAKYKSDGTNTLTALNRDITVTAIPT